MHMRFTTGVFAAAAAISAVPAHAVSYTEGVDVDTYTAAFDASGQPTRNSFVLTAGANVFKGNIASPGDAGDYIPIQVLSGFKLTNLSVALSNSFDLGGNSIFFSNLFGTDVIDHSFSSFTTSLDLGDNFYGLLVGGGTVLADYTVTFDVQSLAVDPGPVDPGAVPEPATWAMMLVGFGAIGVAMRRRQKISTRLNFA